MHSSRKRSYLHYILNYFYLLGTAMGSASFCKFIKRPIFIIGTNISKPLKDCRDFLYVNIYFSNCNQFVIQDCINRPFPKLHDTSVLHQQNATLPMLTYILCLRNVRVRREQLANEFICMIRDKKICPLALLRSELR